MRHISGMEFVFDRELVRAEIKRQRTNQTKVASAVGLTSQSALSNILNGSRKVEVEEARKIYRHLRLVPVSGVAVRTVPIVGLTNAGNWREAIEMPIGTMSIPAAVGSENAFAVEIRGDSMDLLIEDGGYAVVDPAQTSLYDGKVYLIENGEHETTVKRYRTNPARFCPMSSNPEHEDFELGSGHYRVIGRIVWKGGIVP